MSQSFVKRPADGSHSALFGLGVLASERPPCTVCAKPYAEHGSYPTCATHPYTPDGNCQHVGTLTGSVYTGAHCPGAECKSGCALARGEGKAGDDGGKGVEAPAPIPWPKPSDRDWKEDSQQYMNLCGGCCLAFTGHKRRNQCKVCAYGVPVVAVPQRREYWNDTAESKAARMATGMEPGQRTCCNAECGWKGYTERMCGSVGPLCPDCGEVTEPDGVGLPAPAQPLSDERIAEIWVEHGLDECDPEGFARRIEAAHGIGNAGVLGTVKEQQR